jgi:uncharacterized membrane protein
MTRLVVVVYPQEYRAEEVLDTLTQLGRQDLVDLDDAWYASRSGDGKLRLHRLVDVPAANGAPGEARDALMGSACVHPLLDAAGAAMTAGAGRAPAGAGISEQFLGELGKTLEPESSAILALIRQADSARVLAEVVLYGGTVMQTPIAPESEQRGAWDPEALSDEERTTVLLAPADALAAVILAAGGVTEEARGELSRVWWDSVRRFSRALELFPEYVLIESVVDARRNAPGETASRARREARRSCRAAREVLAAAGAEHAVRADYAAFVRSLGMAAAAAAADAQARSRAFEVVHEIDGLLTTPAGRTPS